MRQSSSYHQQQQDRARELHRQKLERQQQFFNRHPQPPPPPQHQQQYHGQPNNNMRDLPARRPQQQQQQHYQHNNNDRAPQRYPQNILHRGVQGQQQYSNREPSQAPRQPPNAATQGTQRPHLSSDHAPRASVHPPQPRYAQAPIQPKYEQAPSQPLRAHKCRIPRPAQPLATVMERSNAPAISNESARLAQQPPRDQVSNIGRDFTNQNSKPSEVVDLLSESDEDDETDRKSTRLNSSHLA